MATDESTEATTDDAAEEAPEMPTEKPKAKAAKPAANREVGIQMSEESARALAGLLHGKRNPRLIEIAETLKSELD